MSFKTMYFLAVLRVAESQAAIKTGEEKSAAIRQEDNPSSMSFLAFQAE
jgi:hypothetical protein